MTRWIATSIALLLPAAALAQPPARLELRDAERIVFLGGALIEEARSSAYLDARLAGMFPKKDLTFRNLGWAGDTVRGSARTSGFENPDGFARLLREVKLTQPTLVFVGYGMSESFEGDAGLPGFVDGMKALLKELDAIKTRIVILSPTFHEDLGRPFPSTSQHNRDLVKYVEALRRLSAERGTPFVDLFTPLQGSSIAAKRLTSNGILLNDTGYWLAAQAIETQIFGEFSPRLLRFDGKVVASEGTEVEGWQQSADGVTIKVLDKMLPTPPLPHGKVVWGRIQATKLVPGNYNVLMDGGIVAEASAAELANGVVLSGGPAAKQIEDLRAALVQVNEQFYRRWRPFNDHSRHWDFMAGDFKLYDRDIAELERTIAKLRRPVAQVIEVRKK